MNIKDYAAELAKLYDIKESPSSEYHVISFLDGTTKKMELEDFAQAFGLDTFFSYPNFGKIYSATIMVNEQTKITPNISNSNTNFCPSDYKDYKDAA